MPLTTPHASKDIELEKSELQISAEKRKDHEDSRPTTFCPENFRTLKPSEFEWLNGTKHLGGRTVLSAEKPVSCAWGTRPGTFRLWVCLLLILDQTQYL